MLDSIHVGMTGLQGYAKGLRVIANNTANLNTPGYKSSTLQFTDLFYASAGASGGGTTRLGHGLATSGTQLDFRQGDLRQTGRDHDLGVEGEGLFVLRQEDGSTRYTRAGQFRFDRDGVLVHQGDGSKVAGRDAAGHIVDVSLAGLGLSTGQPTRSIRFGGNLSSTASQQTVAGIKLHDALGTEHLLSLRLTNTAAETPGSWKLELLEGDTIVGTASLRFEDGRPTPGTAKATVTCTPAGGSAQQVVLDFSADVSSFASGELSTLAMAAQDGHPPGSLVKAAFDGRGVLVASYSNGQTREGARLLLARFPSQDAVQEVGGGRYAEAPGASWELGAAGEGAFGDLRSGMLEISNVDLSREFSNLVVMQRGYQASSQVISTANDMLQELFRLKAR